ncbi:MAG: hypothetical protein F4X97_07040 [Boseongicola sp. SB0662_bin_57]|nr:hypothetical protein [Boseongicola sp. SB0662_bin_57]
MMGFTDLDARVIKERIDMTQLWDAWIEADDLRRHSFLGSMNWESRNGRQYLYSRKGKVVKSLGPRSSATEKAFAAFTEGKRDNNDRLKTLKAEIERQASVLRVLGAGRLPVTAARTLRALRAHGKRTGIRVVGTNALYAYEAMAGVAFNSSSTATGDIDFLIDDRNRLKLFTDEGDRTGLTRLVQAKVDRTFHSRRSGDFRLTNSHGYMIEFIRPQPTPVHRNMPGKEPLEMDDVEPAPIIGLQWLVNAPAVDVIVMDQRGHPAPMRCPDPRCWALHKAWLSEREDRTPDRRRRDRDQASLVMRLIRDRLTHLRYDKELLPGLPGELRRMIPETEPRPSSAQDFGDYIVD